PVTARRSGPCHASRVVRRRLQRADVDGLGALVAGLGVEAHAGALGEGAEPLRVDARVVDEEVLAGVVRRDEAEALVVVEPLDGSGGHSLIPPGISVLRSRRTQRGNDADAGTAWFSMCPTLGRLKNTDVRGGDVIGTCSHPTFVALARRSSGG